MTGPAITVEVETPIEGVMKKLEENRIVRQPELLDSAIWRPDEAAPQEH